jgi:outer membrane protein OmpA-like peptidoglycan-associated protein
MKKRYILTENQLEMIISKQKDDMILQEGPKEIALSILLGVSSLLPGNLMAQKDKNKDVLNQIKNSDVQQQAAQILSDKKNMDYEDALEMIKDNADDFQQGYKSELGSRDLTMKGNTPQEISRILSLIKNGYAIKGVHKDTIINEIPLKDFDAKVNIQSVDVSSENFFKQGSFELNDSTKKHVKEVIESLNQGGRTIVGITIESSTDKERVSDGLKSRLSAMGYDESNQGLSTVRNDKMKKFIIQLGVDEEVIDQDIKWEQGSGELGATTPQDENARYIKVYFFFIEIDEAPEVEDPEEITIETIFELSKPIGKSSTISGGTKAKCYKGKCPTPNNINKIPQGSVLGGHKGKVKSDIEGPLKPIKQKGNINTNKPNIPYSKYNK